MIDLPYRQIHLDFHTSADIPGVGSEFDADEFADSLEAAHVNSITCFSRCHHGMIYHDTDRFPERRHPHLTCNLLPLQIEACHARGIRVPIYITVQWDLFTARQHPEWIALDENGCQVGQKPFAPGFYSRLCLNTPYVDFVEAQTVEVCEMMPVDGFFFDIVAATPCCCLYCINDMQQAGLEPSDPQDRQRFAVQVLHRFGERMFEAVRLRRPEASVFFNSGHVGPRHRAMRQWFTHFELESLPSGGWGYMHFPVAQRYARVLDRLTVSHTGKFHTSWGDFHSFKNPAALQFECFRMLALNARCEIGDQLHPTGKVCRHTLELIGGVYERVEAAEPWCRHAEAVVDIGLMTPEELTPLGGGDALPRATIGAARMLQESQHQFDVIDSQVDLSGYNLVVLPDEMTVTDELAARLAAYVQAGGSVLASYKSGFHPDGDRFNVPELGVTLVGDADVAPDFIVPGRLGNGMADTGHVMYLQGLEVQPSADAEVLSTVLKPYFSRTYRHFCSHRHTPIEGPADYPGAVRNGNCIYLMHPVFTMYDRNAPLWCKRIALNAIDMLLPEPVLRTDAPSTAFVTVNRQRAHNRLVVHALHYIPERRGQDFDTIEDIIPIHDVRFSVLAPGQVSAVYLEPQHHALDFGLVSGRIEFVIPEIPGYQIVAIHMA